MGYRDLLQNIAYAHKLQYVDKKIPKAIIFCAITIKEVQVFITWM